ncbi:hypothetical protein RJ639_030813 [Escallonia herrerae]|uniref:Aminoacylase-1 n=1 Tax=Escallonia herrerae TaxID=1293975 RepID=A0AA88WYT5_9ASTE|nr:hypothetical protein RJ639_030813 [Escallonia herrerae]
MSKHNHHHHSLLLSTLLLLSLSLLSPTTQSDYQQQEDTPITRFQKYLRINTAATTFLTTFSASIPNLTIQLLHLTTPQKPLLLTLLGSNPSLPSILLNSHLDSVPTEPNKWSHPPFSAFHSPDGKIFAGGAQDDKCIGLQYLEAIKNRVKDSSFKPLRTIHVSYVPDEEIGGLDEMAKFVKSDVFNGLNVGFVLDVEFRVFYADRTPWNLVIRAGGMPGHGSRMFDNSAMENLIKSVEVVGKFRENQFDLVKAGLAANSEVVSVNPVYGFVMNMQPSEAEAGFDVRLPPTTDPDLLKRRIADEWAPATRNMTYGITEKVPIRDYKGRPLMTPTDDSNPWWSLLITAAGGKLAKLEILPSTTDARFTREMGIPTLGFSPMKYTPILLHDHNEFLKDTVYLVGIKVYEALIKSLSSSEGGS